jgi:choline dehydrogenase-like flavoprotein
MGGGTAAWALAQRGIDVLVVERGEAIPKEAANLSPREVFINRRYKPAETWRDGSGRSFRPGVHYVVGGNTKVYGASLPRFRESDFGRVEHHEGISPAWPFSYADLEPYYGQAERLYNVHGATGSDPSEPWRSEPYPFEAVPHEPYVAALADRLRSAGVSPSPTSMGIDLRPEGACIRCSTCAFDAKGDSDTCALRPAIATGNVRLLTGTRVTRICTDSSPRVVSHLEAEGPDGPVRIVGDRYVIAAGAANSAALLLASANADHPTGLANSSDQVGRNFMMHNNAHIACMDLDRINEVVFQKTLQVNDWYHDGGDGRPLGTLQMLGKVQGIMMKSWATRVPLAALDVFAARSVEWLVMTEDLPSPDNRVTLDGDGTIRVTRTAVGTSTHRTLLRRAKQLMRKAGYDIIGVQPFDISMNSHMCGTLVAGNDPGRSVLDPWCRTHDVENLWVLDSGFFPSSAAMNPALTIAAQALRAVAESPLGR